MLFVLGHPVPFQILASLIIFFKIERNAVYICSLLVALMQNAILVLIDCLFVQLTCFIAVKKFQCYFLGFDFSRSVT